MTRLGGYELWARIGTGSTGAVWKAYRGGSASQIVALKRLRSSARSRDDVARIRREAEALAALDHPHIVRLVEVVEDGGGLALAMELAAGGSLDTLLAERGQLTPGEVVAVAAPLADALAAAHRRGIVHGDVKAANVLFTAEGEPLLSDFDVARTLGRLGDDQVAGTAEYLAPELLDGAPPDQRSDIYSLAVVCYEALTGYPPYAGAVTEQFARVPDLQGPLADVVERAMARDPARRFRFAGELARALRASVPADAIVLPGPASTGTAIASSPGRERRGGPTETFGPRPPRPQPRRRRWPVVVAVLGAGLVVGALLWILLSTAIR